MYRTRVQALKASTILALVVSFCLALVGGIIVPHSLPRGADGSSARSSLQDSPLATTDDISSNGVGPTTVSLVWAQSGDVFFVSYTLQYATSSSNGPWTTLVSFTAIGDTSYYVYGLTPSSTYWWQVVDTDSFGTAVSNQLQVNQPKVAALSYALPTSTSAQFNWNNHASYGGYVAFESYQLMESVNGGTYTAATSITTESTMSYALNGLSLSTSYSFYLITTDQCSGCSGGNFPSPSDSNIVAFTTHPPLSASATATPTIVDVGQSVSFTCSAGGGAGPYTFTWNFGDGTTGSGQSVTHSYNSASSDSVVCTALDSDGSTATGAVSVKVDSLPTVQAPTGSPGTILEGNSVTFSVGSTPGSGDLTYSWSGLPPGCSSSDSATVSCTPSSSGTFEISVTVTDSNGGTATSSGLNYTVSQSTLGLPAAEGFELIAAILGGILAVVIVVVIALVLRRRRGGRTTAGQPIHQFENRPPEGPPPPK